ncbi:unnamed protein product [Ectocarpus sp. 6 AP-2014]
MNPNITPDNIHTATRLRHRLKNSHCYYCVASQTDVNSGIESLTSWIDTSNAQSKRLWLRVPVGSIDPDDRTGGREGAGEAGRGETENENQGTDGWEDGGMGGRVGE